MKAICVFSGGLDSMLSAQIIREQGIEVIGVFFKTPFFGPERAIRSARHIGLPLEIFDITEEHLRILKNPKYGYGENMNPCIDCHSLMFRIAKRIMEDKGASFVISGEVLGQRPMSQNRKALDIVSKESGLGRLLLRPLSAKKLPVTIPEEKGWVKRELLYGIHGRSRKVQMELAKKFNIREYPSPAGGCLLTEKGFSKRLRDLLETKVDPEIREIELLKYGRHFRIDESTKIIVGRNRVENEKIRELLGKEDIIFEPKDIPGPTVLLTGEKSEKNMELASDLTATYCNILPGNSIDIIVYLPEGKRIIKGKAHEKIDFHGLLI